MATAGAVGKRRADAIARIERTCETLAGGKLNLPVVSRHGSDMLLVFQLEAIADFLELNIQPVEDQPAAKARRTKRGE